MAREHSEEAHHLQGFYRRPGRGEEEEEEKEEEEEAERKKRQGSACVTCQYMMHRCMS